MNTVNISQERGLSYPKGFKVSALSCGIKTQGLNDLALLCSEKACQCIGLFTKNKFKAHSIVINNKHLKNNIARAVIVNSGNANCLNGESGYKAAISVIKNVAKQLNIQEDDVVMASTGKIGEPFPLNRVLDNIPELVSKLDSCKVVDVDFSKAIMTTDTRIKMATTSIEIYGSEVRIAGVAKGAGMISPNLATMLAFFTTDINIDMNLLKEAFRFCIDETFNNINVDAQTSTNDMAMIFSNGLSNNEFLNEENDEFKLFRSALLAICKKLSYDIISDAEGATKVIKVLVRNALTKKDAKSIANLVASSNLVKTFIYGENFNWGRIVQAIGKTESDIITDKIEIKVNGNIVFEDSHIKLDNVDSDVFKSKEVFINIDLKMGKDSSFIMTCDLSPEYVKINSKY